jgi:hypothetical protein
MPKAVRLEINLYRRANGNVHYLLVENAYLNPASQCCQHRFKGWYRFPPAFDFFSHKANANFMFSAFWADMETQNSYEFVMRG